jgi:long-chain acyl-CoA synthetase
MIKSPLFHQATERNGIMDIGVQTGAQNVPYTQQSPKMIMNTYWTTQSILFCIWCRNTSKVNLIKDKVPNLKEVFSFNPIEGCKTGKNYSLENQAIKMMLNTAKVWLNLKMSHNHLHVGTTGRPKELCSHTITSSDVLNSSRIPFEAGKVLL